MTLQEIAEYDREWLTCAQVAPLLGSDPYDLHIQAMEDPTALGFPVIIVKRRVKIPRRPFLAFMGTPA